MNNTIQTETIKNKVEKLFNQLMKDAPIPAAFIPAARNLVVGYLKRADEGQLRTVIEGIRSEVIPWLLDETDGNTNQ